jgi:P4 family phage/plasmid primase-like protien
MNNEIVYEKDILIYGLHLTQGKYYVGKTDNLARRFKQHKDGTGSVWTKLYPPILDPIVLKDKADLFDENVLFKKWALKYGIDNVRGDIYCQIILSEADRIHLLKELDSAKDSCYKCHGLGHFVSDCTAELKQTTNLYKNKNINNGIINNGHSTNINIHEDQTNVQLDFISDIKDIKIFNDDEKDYMLLEALNGDDDPMANLLYIISNKRFHYTAESGWWMWNGIWKAGGQAELTSVLRYEISSLLLKVRLLYKDLAKFNYNNNSNNSNNSNTSNSSYNSNNSFNNNYDKKILMIDKIRKRLCSREYKQKIIGESEWVFASKCNKNFEKLLDSNPYLICFQNGVYDLKHMLFRETQPEDFISITLDYDYADTIDDSYKKDLNNFFESIMPDPNDRHYMLKLLSTGLVGENKNELFHIFTGSGRNGKSKLSELLKCTLGEYYASFSSTFLTAKMSNPGQASPHLMTLKKKRLILGSEPNHKFKLNATLIKSLSGNDDIVGRKLYGEQESFRPNFKMILLCNDIPEIDASDKAIWLRCRCLAFPTSFVFDPKLPHEKEIDLDLSSKIPNWRLAFFHLLLEKYNCYLSEGLKMTPNMYERTRNYQAESDMYFSWINERIEKSTNHIHTCTLYEDYKNWHIKNCSSVKMPLAAHFTKGIGQYLNIKKAVKVNGYIKQGVEHYKLISC